MRILVVEDEFIIAMSIIRELVKIGHEAIGPAASADDALAQYQTESPDIIMMDIYLEGEMNGIEAASRIRKTPDEDIPIIFVTASTDPVTIESAKEISNSTLLRKPYKRSELLQIFERMPK